MHAQQHAVEGAFADVHAGPCGSKGVALVGIFAGEVRSWWRVLSFGYVHRFACRFFEVRFVGLGGCGGIGFMCMGDAQRSKRMRQCMQSCTRVHLVPTHVCVPFAKLHREVWVRGRTGGARPRVWPFEEHG